ncbi:hypothetical protein [Legionella busanensis]|nr:hypothetical protein [Legionella busanensis]
MLEEPTEFKRLIQNVSHIEELSKKFPAYKTQCINILLNDSEEFQRLIQSTYDLSRLRDIFPCHEKDLIAKLFANDLQEFKRLILKMFDIEVITRDFPTYADQCLKVLINDPQVFKEVIKSISDISFLAKQFPKYKKPFIAMLLNEEEFNRLIVDTGDTANELYNFAKSFPAYFYPLYNKAFKNFSTFEKIFKYSHNVQPLCELFKVKISKSDLNEAVYTNVKATLNKSELKRNISLIKQALRTKTSFFQILPQELRTTIIAATRNSEIQSEKEANDFINREYSKIK